MATAGRANGVLWQTILKAEPTLSVFALAAFADAANPPHGLDRFNAGRALD